MAANFKTNCWTEYIRRCVQCHSLRLPEAHTFKEIERLPNIARQLSEKVLLNLIIDQSTKLDEEDTDLIVQRYISDLNERREYKIACTLVQGPTGDIHWVDENELERQENDRFVWCRLDVKNFHSATALPAGNSEHEKIQLQGHRKRKGAFHGDLVRVDKIKKCVLFDEDTEEALINAKFGMSFLCRVDPKNPILFFPLDRRHPKFTNLPIISCRTRSVVCFDPSSIGPTSANLKVSDLIPHECAIKMLFVVKFLGWQKKKSYPLGIIVGALPACRSPYIGDLVLRIANGIPLAPCNPVCDPATPVNQGVSLTPRVFQDAFTIDPQGCTDHDDALTCKLVKDKDGTVYEIGVHIINVQKHVPKDGNLDKAAFERGCAAYRSRGNCISPMLPHAMIQDKLSISAGEPRDTISVLTRFRLKNGIAEPVSDTAYIVESQVTSALDLSYEEAQKVICDELEFPDDPCFSAKLQHYNSLHQFGCLSIEERIRVLWKVATALRKRRLGPWGAYCFHLDDPDKVGSPEAHYLVEELMIWANTQVANKLLKTFPDHTILRVQDSPSSEEMVNLLAKHGGIMAASLGLRTCVPTAHKPVQQLHILQSTYDEIKRLLGQCLVRDTLHQVQFESLHPQTAIAIISHRRSHSHTDYVISERGKLEYPHDSLKCQHYTHFTSPIRRYIDIVIQRLIHASINHLPCPYNHEELKRVCHSMKSALKRSNNYEREISKFDLAMELYSSSEVFTGFVFEIIDDAELDLLFPDPRMKVLYARERKIPLKHLNAFRIPSLGELDSSTVPAASNMRDRVVTTPEDSLNTPFTWKVKMTSFSGSAQSFFENSKFEVLPDAAVLGDSESYADISLFVADDGPSRASCLREHKLKVRLKPLTHTIPLANWKSVQEFLPLDLSKEDPDELSERLWSIFNVSSGSPHPALPASLSKQCRAHSPLWIYELHRPIRMYEVLQVQLSASPLEYILSPCVQLVEVGPEVRICVQHNNNPAECFCDKLTQSASKQRYSSVDDYFECWEKVLLAEAAIVSIQDSDLLLIKDVVMKWPKLDADINSAGQVSYKLHIPASKKEAGVQMDLPHDFVKMSYEFFKFNSGDLACVRYSITDHDGKMSKAVFHMVVHHVNVICVKVDDQIQVDRATVYLKFVGDTSNYISPVIAKLLSNGPHHEGLKVSCEVQLIPLTLPFRYFTFLLIIYFTNFACMLGVSILTMLVSTLIVGVCTDLYTTLNWKEATLT